MSRTCLTFLNLLTLKHTLCRLPWPGALLQCSADSRISCICSFRHSPFWTTIEPPCRGHANHLQDSFSSILMYFFHVKKLQSEDNYGACFKGFLTSLRWIKKKVSQQVKMCPRVKLWQLSKANGKKSHYIQSDARLYSGLYIHDKWTFNDTFLQCYNLLFISSEPLTFCCVSSIKALFIRFNCPRATKSNVFFFFLMM